MFESNGLYVKKQIYMFQYIFYAIHLAGYNRFRIFALIPIIFLSAIAES